MKTPKKSTSHVVNLKRRTIDRIRKTQSPDIPPVSVKRTFIPAVEDEYTDEERLAMIQDATAGLPPEALPETPMERALRTGKPDPENNIGVVSEDKLYEEFASRPNFKIPPFTQLPVEHHGTQNDLARQIIARVPAPKLDPNSEEAELARLQKHQMPVKKKGES